MYVYLVRYSSLVGNTGYIRHFVYNLHLSTWLRHIRGRVWNYLDIYVEWNLYDLLYQVIPLVLITRYG